MIPDHGLDELRAFASHLADAADTVSLEHFGGRLESTRKPDGTPVTRADRAVEAMLRGRIAQAYPSHGLLGEEDGGELDPAAPTWVIDPIDGTKNFLRGVPVYATLIALVVGGRAVVGVASAPAMGERWDAAAGRGVRRNGRPAAVSGVERLGDAHVVHSGLRWWRDTPGAWDLLGHLADNAWRTRGFGDFWIHLLVAGGMADAALEQDLKIWDVAALECIVTEAGGRVTGFDGGSPLRGGSVLTTNGPMHPVMRRLLTDFLGVA